MRIRLIGKPGETQGKSPALAQIIPVLTNHDAADPGKELALAIVFAKGFPCREERFLREVLGRIRIFAKKVCLPQQSILDGRAQLHEGIRIAAPGGSDCCRWISWKEIGQRFVMHN
jgi:hypothetical protein